jgi:hypothetical protein
MGLVSPRLRNRIGSARNCRHTRAQTAHASAASERRSDARRTERRSAAMQSDDLIHRNWKRISRHDRKIKRKTGDISNGTRLRRAEGQRALIARPVARVGLGLVRTAVVQGFLHVGGHNCHFLRCDLSQAVRHRAGNGSSRHRQHCHRQRGHQSQDGSREAHRRFTHPPIHAVRAGGILKFLPCNPKNLADR